jgi:HicB family
VTKPAVVYVRMAPALRDALREHAESSGLSLNAFVVHALAAASGPEFLRHVRDGGKPSTVADDREVVRRPSPDRMTFVVAAYRDYWLGKLGMERIAEIMERTKDHDLVWAWWVGHRAEQDALPISRRGAR